MGKALKGVGTHKVPATHARLVSLIRCDAVCVHVNGYFVSVRLFAFTLREWHK